jgi:hypothetical protein
MSDQPSILVFDVNETLIDIGSLEPHFERMFDDRRVVPHMYGTPSARKLPASAVPSSPVRAMRRCPPPAYRSQI